MCAHEVNKTANHVGVIKVIYYRTPQLREVDDLHYMMIHVLQITCCYKQRYCDAEKLGDITGPVSN